MKFTRKFLDGYITYDENDSFVHANSFLGYIIKSIVSIIFGTLLGVVMLLILGFLAYLGFSILAWLSCFIFE